ncbi:MAG: hypothetical protein RLO50_16160 [Azospirillaceae bacterium]
MAADNQEVDKDLLAARQEMWRSFTKWSTVSIVGIAIILILMALFLY